MVVLSACSPHFSSHPSAEEMLSALDKPWIGRAGVEQSFFANDVEADILAGICTATPQWLEVARRMSNTGNAHWGEEMSSALAVALTKEPEVVLRSFGDVCAEPEDDLPDSCAVPHWRATALEALKTVDDPSVAAVKEQCAIGVTRSVGPQSIDESQSTPRPD
jgi:hypothetical protein